MSQASSSGAAAPATPAASAPPKSIFLYSYPKIVFLYPTMIAALIAGIYMSFVPVTSQAALAAAVADVGGDATPAAASPERSDTYIVSAVFLMVFGLNLVVFSFDFPRTTSLTLFFFICAIILGLLLTFRLNDQILPTISSMLKSFQPIANATFFYSVFGILALIFAIVFANVQFDYWEVAPNELLHHHGFLSNMERFAAPSLKIDKEITDIFEFFLLRSGRLILHPSNEPRAFVLENVMNITRKEAQLTKMLGALQVQVRSAQAGE